MGRVGTIFKINYLNSKINETNLKLKKLCDEKDCRYIDIHRLLVDENGELNHTYNEDGCHPNEEAYRIISQVLTPIIVHEMSEYK